MDNEIVLKDFLQSSGKNYVKNNAVTRKKTNLNLNQMREAINTLVDEGVLCFYQRSAHTLMYKVNRGKIPLQGKPVNPTDKSVQTLKQYLIGKQYLKNISSVGNQLNLSYITMKRAVDELVQQGVLCLHSEHSNGHKIYSINFPSVQQL